MSLVHYPDSVQVLLMYSGRKPKWRSTHGYYSLAENGGRLSNISVNNVTMRQEAFVPYGLSRAVAESLSHNRSGVN